MPVLGSDNNDTLGFQGTLQQFTMTLVNPYSGQTFHIDDIKRVNTGLYDGLGGNDIVSMSADGDVIFLNDGNGNPTITNIETIIAGAGGDIIALADAFLLMGNINVAGGGGDDIIWTNAGDDVVSGADGNDIIDGGPGNDILRGENDNDLIWGGFGNDWLEGGGGADTLFGGFNSDTLLGGNGNDILYGGNGPGDNPDDFIRFINNSHIFVGAQFPSPADKPTHAYIPPVNQGIAPSNLQISYSTTVHVEYVFSEAGYQSSLGFYRIGADGAISNVDIVFKNQHQHAYGSQFSYDYEGEAGGSLGIFILANGYGADSFYRNADLSGGTLNFIYHLGLADERIATVNDAGADVRLVFDDGTTRTALNVTAYHSALSGGVPSLNADGLVHTISGLVDENDPTVFRIGFEDLSYLGDADFDDIVFNMTVEDRIIIEPGIDDDDILDGGAGNDTLYGGFGNDLLIFGRGADDLYGGAGRDIFAANFIDNQVDQIFDFETGANGDILNLTDILVEFDPLADAINDFLRLTHDGANDRLLVNADGDVGGAFTHILTFEGGLGGLDLAALLAGGNLVLDHSAIA